MTFRMVTCIVSALLSLLIYGLAAFGASDTKYLDGIEAGNELINKDPNDFSGYASRGCSYSYLKKYKLAETDLLKAISLKPDEAGLYAHLADVYSSTKKYGQALTASRKVIELGIRTEHSYNALIANLCLSNHFDECLSKCDDIILQYPTDAFAYFYRAICKNELNSFSKNQVLADLLKAHMLKPEDEGFKRLYEQALAGKSIKLIRR